MRLRSDSAGFAAATFSTTTRMAPPYFAIYAESSKPIEVHQPCLIRALIVAKQEVAEWRSSR